MAIAPDGKNVAYVDSLGLLHIWNVPQGSSYRPAEFIERKIERIAFDPLGRYLAAGDSTGIVWVQSLADRELWMRCEPKWTVGNEEGHQVLDLAFNIDGSELFVVTNKFFLHTWKVQQEPQLEVRERRMWLRWLKPLPSGGALTMGEGRGSFDLGMDEKNVRPQNHAQQKHHRHSHAPQRCLGALRAPRIITSWCGIGALEKPNAGLTDTPLR